MQHVKKTLQSKPQNRKKLNKKQLFKKKLNKSTKDRINLKKYGEKFKISSIPISVLNRRKLFLHKEGVKLLIPTMRKYTTLLPTNSRTGTNKYYMRYFEIINNNND